MEAFFQAGYNVLNCVVDYDYNEGKEAEKLPDLFYIELYYGKQFMFNKFGKNVKVTYDMASLDKTVKK